MAAVVDSIDEPASLLGHSYGATVALGTALVARNLRGLVLYESTPGMSVVASEDLERIEDLVARDEREEVLVHALRVFGLTIDELEQIRASPTWAARVAAAHTVAREVRAEEACRWDPAGFRELAARSSSCSARRAPTGRAREPTGFASSCRTRASRFCAARGMRRS